MKNIMVVVVDDNMVSRLLPGFILRTFDRNVQVMESESGIEALRLIEIHRVSHVLLDISMPEINGIELAQKIKEKSNNVNLKIIAYTADSLISNVIDLKSFGFDGILVKPVKSSDLLVALGVLSDHFE